MRSFFLMLLVPFIWSLNSFIGKVLIETLPPFTISGARFTVAGVIFVLWIILTRKKLPRANFSFYRDLFILSVSGIFAFNSIYYIGLKYTSIVNASIINAFNPIPIIILSAIFLKEKVTWQQYLGALLSIVGVVFIVSSGNLNLFSFNLGDILILIDTFIWAIFSIVGKKVMQLITPLETVAFSTLMALPLLWLVSTIELNVYQVNKLDSSSIAAIVFLGIFASCLAFVWWYKGIDDFGASGSAVFYNLIPVYSLLLIRFYYNEPVYLYQIAGGLLTIVGVLISSLSLTRAKEN